MQRARERAASAERLLPLQHDHLVEAGVSAQHGGRVRFDDPGQAGLGQRPAQALERGQGMDHVAQGAEADQEDAQGGAQPPTGATRGSG